jgi:hypothetical protein
VRIFRGKKLTGGTASRAEVYGLFLAAILIVGGGIGGAVALINTEVTKTEAPLSSNSPSPNSSDIEKSTSPNNSSEQQSDAENVVESGEGTGQQNQIGISDQNAPGSQSNNQQLPGCRYTNSELAYFAQQKADLQAQLNPILAEKNQRIANYRDVGRLVQYRQHDEMVQYHTNWANQFIQSNPEHYQNIMNTTVAYWVSLRDRYADPNYMTQDLIQAVANFDSQISDLTNRINLIPGC